MANLKIANLITDGNSITNGHIAGGETGDQTTDAWPVVCRGLLIADASPTRVWSVKSVAVSGATTQARIDLFDTAVRPLFAPAFGLNVLTFFEATNDFIGGALTVDQAIDKLKTYAVLALRMGWTLQLITPPRTTSVDAKPKILAFNEWLLSVSGGQRYSSLPVLDIASDSRLAVPVAGGTYYQADGIHPKVAGYAVIAELVKARLATL